MDRIRSTDKRHFYRDHKTLSKGTQTKAQWENLNFDMYLPTFIKIFFKILHVKFCKIL